MVTALGVVSAEVGHMVTTLGVSVEGPVVEPPVIVIAPGTPGIPGVVSSSGHGVENVTEPNPGGVTDRKC